MIRCYRTRVVTDQRARPSGTMPLGIGLEPASTLFGLRETKNCRRICGRRRAAYRPTQSSLNNGRTHTPRTVSDPAPEQSALPSRHLRAACAIMAAVTLVGCCTETRSMHKPCRCFNRSRLHSIWARYAVYSLRTYVLDHVQGPL